MKAFEFATATRIVFGDGVSTQLPKLAAVYPPSLLIVTGSQPARHTTIWTSLEQAGLSLTFFPVKGEPTTLDVIAGTELARQAGCQTVLGLGGGSVLDAGKAIAALLTNGGEPLDYLEVIGRGLPLSQPSAPYLAVPTTAGTGAEVTRNAVLASPEHRLKVSLRSPFMLPALAVVDPLLTHSAPPDVTASTGMDALTQLIEPFVSSKANPLTDALCRAGIPQAAAALRRVYADGSDAAARSAMSFASLNGGLALANAGLGAVHGFAGPIGGLFPAPHGAICARLLPLVMEANIKALESRHAGHVAIERYIEIAQIVTGDKNASAQEGVKWVSDLVSELNIPPLSALGMNESQIPEAVEKTLNASSFKGNPIALSDGELREILERAL